MPGTLPSSAAAARRASCCCRGRGPGSARRSGSARRNSAPASRDRRAGNRKARREKPRCNSARSFLMISAVGAWPSVKLDLDDAVVDADGAAIGEGEIVEPLRQSDVVEHELQVLRPELRRGFCPRSPGRSVRCVRCGCGQARAHATGSGRRRRPGRSRSRRCSDSTPAPATTEQRDGRREDPPRRMPASSQP